MLTKVQRDTWAAALRSGEYKQGTKKLTSSAGYYATTGDPQHELEYCCLGVLNACLNLPMLYGDTLTRHQQDTFINMNDRDHLSFSQIANAVDLLPVSDEC